MIGRISIILFIVFTSFLSLPLVSHANEVTIVMNETEYQPKNLEISQGTTVIFENKSGQNRWPASNIHPTHQIYSEFDPKKPVPNGTSWSFTFTKPGIWQYHDHEAPTITGTITVAETMSTVDDNETSAAVKRATRLEKILGFFQNLFAKLFANDAKKDTSLTIEQVKDSEAATKRAKNYNDQIDKNSTTIFVNEDDLYSYVKKFGPEETVKQLHTLSSQFGDCHQSAHDAGHFAYEIYNEKAFQTCSAECHSGCYHGATEAYFKEHGTNKLAQNLNIICNSTNPFVSHQCIHGIGHGLMAWSNYEIHTALKNCDLLDRLQDSCYTGVFMENIVGGLAEEAGHQTKYLSDDPQFPCTVVDEKYKSACYFYQTSRMVQLFKGDFEQVAKACNSSPEIYQVSCFQSMGRDVGGVTRGNPTAAIAACSHAPAGDDRINCLSGAVQDTLWDPSGAPNARKFCEALTDSNEKNACYETIFYRARDVFPTMKEKQNFCSEIEKTYRPNCNQITAT